MDTMVGYTCTVTWQPEIQLFDFWLSGGIDGFVGYRFFMVCIAENKSAVAKGFRGVMGGVQVCLKD